MRRLKKKKGNVKYYKDRERGYFLFWHFVVVVVFVFSYGRCLSPSGREGGGEADKARKSLCESKKVLVVRIEHQTHTHTHSRAFYLILIFPSSCALTEVTHTQTRKKNEREEYRTNGKDAAQEDGKGFLIKYLPWR